MIPSLYQTRIHRYHHPSTITGIKEDNTTILGSPDRHHSFLEADCWTVDSRKKMQIHYLQILAVMDAAFGEHACGLDLVRWKLNIVCQVHHFFLPRSMNYRPEKSSARLATIKRWGAGAISCFHITRPKLDSSDGYTLVRSEPQIFSTMPSGLDKNYSGIYPINPWFQTQKYF
jgi:hypothetical protein